MNRIFNPADLAHFTGTERYYRLNRKCLITDGAKYLADSAEAYWLLDAAASYLFELGTADWFVLVRLNVKNYCAELTLEDGNGGIRARQGAYSIDGGHSFHVDRGHSSMRWRTPSLVS